MTVGPVVPGGGEIPEPISSPKEIASAYLSSIYEQMQVIQGYFTEPNKVGVESTIQIINQYFGDLKNFMLQNKTTFSSATMSEIFGASDSLQSKWQQMEIYAWPPDKENQELYNNALNTFYQQYQAVQDQLV